jgi:hypothetical protein
VGDESVRVSFCGAVTGSTASTREGKFKLKAEQKLLQKLFLR